MVAGPRRRKAACLSTAGKAEERKAIAQKTGHGFLGELRKKQKTAKTTVFKTFDGFYGSRYLEKRHKKGGGFKEKIKYPFSGLFQNIITKIHTIFFTGSTQGFSGTKQIFFGCDPSIKDFCKF